MSKHGLSILLTLCTLLGASQSWAVSFQVPVAAERQGVASIAASEYLPLSRASANLQKGENTAALRDLQATVEKNPVNILGLFHLGSVYLELAKHSTTPVQQQAYLEKSQQAFERVIDLNSDLTLVYFKLGKVALMKNDIEAAKGYYRAGLAVEPKNAALIFNLARVYDQNNEKAAAMASYLKTIQADPNFTFAYNNLALLYEENKDYVNAEKVYKQALKRDAAYNLARLNLGNMYAASGNYAAAQKTLLEAQAQESDNEWVYFYQGNLALRMNDYAKAATAYNQALALNPQHGAAYYLLAVSLTKLNRMDEALQAGLHYLSVAPDGEYAREMQSLVLTVKLSQSHTGGGLILNDTPAALLMHSAKE